MNKISSMAFMVITAMFIFFQSCGDVDHSNPRSVADKAMEYYISNDYQVPQCAFFIFHVF